MVFVHTVIFIFNFLQSSLSYCISSLHVLVGILFDRLYVALRMQ